MLVIGPYGKEQGVYEFTMIQRLGGRYGEHHYQAAGSDVYGAWLGCYDGDRRLLACLQVQDTDVSFGYRCCCCSGS